MRRAGVRLRVNRKGQPGTILKPIREMPKLVVRPCSQRDGFALGMDAPKLALPPFG
jgi:hypothetical protein